MKVLVYITSAIGGLGGPLVHIIKSKNGTYPDGICCPSPKMVEDGDTQIDCLVRILREQNRLYQFQKGLPYWLREHPENFISVF